MGLFDSYQYDLIAGSIGADFDANATSAKTRLSSDVTVARTPLAVATFRGLPARRLDWLPVTLLIRPDQFCIGQHVALHGSLDLRSRRTS